MAWRTKNGQTSPDRPHRRGTDAVKGYASPRGESPARRVVRTAEQETRWAAMSEQERSDFTQRVLWGDDD